MHFWIDKRSQQSGFGRSRVAASLSGSSSGGLGLGFGHPPRRLHSSNKSSSSMSTASGSNQISSIHSTARHHQQQQQPQYTSNNASTSTANVGSEHSSFRNFQQPLFANNNNFQTSTANSRNTQQQQQHNQVNNNAHPPMQHQQFNNSNVNTALNNNLQSQRTNGQGGLNTASTTTQDLQHQHNHHHHYYQHDVRYHHPQFGNMSVRHYQPSNSNNPNQVTVNSQRTNTTMTTLHSSLPEAQPAILNNLNGANGHTNTTTPQRTNLNIVSSQSVNEQQSRVQQLQLLPQHVNGSYHDVHHNGRIGNSTCLQQQPSNRQSANYHNGSPRIHVGVQCPRANAVQTSGSPNLLLNNASVSNNNEIRTGSSSAFCNEYHNHYQHQQQQQQTHAQHRQLHALIDPADTQLLPSHLKSGVCASLVLASIFVAAAKFYFDHQNSGLEVLIFIAFSMTFLLAACTVSLCRIPKGIIVQQRPSAMHGDHAPSRGVSYSTAADISGNPNHIGLSNPCQQVILARPLPQEHGLAQAGPPPYHIAILLPENGCKDEEESPPPSYDKILL